MRILALSPGGLVLPHIHASMVKAFRSLDIKALDIPVPRNWDEFRFFLNAHRSDFDAGFVVDLGGNSTFKQFFREIQITLKFPWIIWFVDDPEGYSFPESCEPEWSYVFCWDREISHRLSIAESWRGRPIVHLPLAVSPELFFPESPGPKLDFPGGVFVGSTRHENYFLEEAAAKIPDFKQHEKELWKVYSQDFSQPLRDLVWQYLSVATGKSIGSIRQDPLAKLWVLACAFKLGIRKRKEVAAQILKRGVIFGDAGWRETMDDRYQGSVKYGVELCAIYNRSSFVLDIRQPQSRTGLTQRIFDASGCGVPLLAEWSPELGSLFEPEKELLSYRTLEEGILKAAELLQFPRRGKIMAERAKKRVLREHTYQNRALQILQSLESGPI